MANFANVFANIEVLKVAVQRIPDEHLGNEMRQSLSELHVMIEQIQLDQSSGVEASTIERKVKKAAEFVYWLDRILELFM